MEPKLLVLPAFTLIPALNEAMMLKTAVTILGV